MDILKIILQLIIALGIFNVWLLRFNKPSVWRGGQATDMRSEFESYGLTQSAMYIVGGLKCLFATGLIIGIWMPGIAQISAYGIAILMAGAISMHMRINDPPKRSLPAAILLLLSLLVGLL